MDNTLEPVIVNPVLPAKATVIWLHGLGADGHDFVNIVSQLQLPDILAVRFVFPHASLREVTLAGAYPMHAWFDIKSLTTDFAEAEDVAGIKQSQSVISELIANEIAQGIPSEKIVLAGFSQGGAMALHCGLRYPQKLAGILALSTWLPLLDSVAQERDPVNFTIPIAMMHGSADTMLPISWAQKSSQYLQELGYPVDFHSYSMAHTVCCEEVMAISKWLCVVLGT